MKKTNVKLLPALLLLIGFHTSVLAQVSVNSNGIPGVATDYVGWNATRLFPLTVAHKGNFPILFQTNGIQRIYIDNATGGINGSVGIGSDFNSFFKPLSILHIAQDNGSGTAGSTRNWMSPGVPGAAFNTTGTGMLISNGDNVWLGLRHKGVYDANDAVLAWGDNGGPGTDYFRFVLNHWNLGNPNSNI